MKKRDCAIVQDLLALYEDDVLQEESRQMVEEHLRSCGECMQIYENAERPIKVEEIKKKQREEEQAEEAAGILKKFKRRTTYKSTLIVGVILAVLLLAATAANEICNRVADNNWGIAGMLYTISPDKIKVTELYQLKNGDIYCTLESDKRIGIYQYSDYIVPGNAFEESTDDAALEVCFRQVAPWEKEDYPTIYRMSAVFSAERKGIQKESGGEIVQRCSEIRYRGKTEADSMVLWKRGQKLEEAPEEIERKAIAEYVRNGQIEEAVRECENLGWDSGGEIVKVYQEDSDISQEYSSGSSGESAVFPHDNETILIPQCEEP